MLNTNSPSKQLPAEMFQMINCVPEQCPLLELTGQDTGGGARGHTIEFVQRHTQT